MSEQGFSNHELFIARVAHEANRAWCIVNGDYSQQPWEAAPVSEKRRKCNAVKFYRANPVATANAFHENWMKQKLEEGWAYGEMKDLEKKTHPCLVPFDQLPEVQQKQVKLFIAIVHVLL